MNVLMKLRTDAGRSRAKVAREADIDAGTYGWIESGRFNPYPIQLERIATALGWTGDPAALLEEVPPNDAAPAPEDVTEHAVR